MIERTFNCLNRWRWLATRYDKHAIVYLGGFVLRSRAALANRLRRRLPVVDCGDGRMGTESQGARWLTAARSLASVRPSRAGVKR